MEDAFHDFIDTDDEEDTVTVFVIHKNVITYFLSRIFNTTMQKMSKCMRHPYCSIVELQENDILLRKVSTHTNHVLM